MDAIMDGPALEAPKGLDSNLDNPPNNNGSAMFVLVFCSVVSTVCVLLRAYGRVYLLKRFQVEEALILSAYGIFWACVWSAFGFMSVPGYFVHQWNVRMRDLIPMTYYVFVMGNSYVVVLMLLKVAMLSEWARILVPRNTRTSSIFWWSCMTMIALQAIACVGIVIGLNLQCIPHQASWDFTIADAKCFPLYRLQLSSGIIYLATDIIMFFMPQHLIWRLQMSWKKRLGVSVVFGLGLLACVAAAFRLDVTINVGKSPDGTYSLGKLIFWVMAEMTCGFFVVCVPCVPKILRDSGTIPSIKRRLGMTTSDLSKPSAHASAKGGVSASRTLQSTNSKPYYKLDEDGVQMRDMKTGSTSSTERLRQEDNSNDAARAHIVQTTRITVHESVDDGYGRRETDSKNAWVM